MHVSDSLFRMLFLNVQSLANKMNELSLLLISMHIHFLCVSEHWLVEGSLAQTRLPGYCLVSYFCRNGLKNGGVALYSHQNYFDDCRTIDVNMFCLEQHCEVACVQLKSLNLVVIGVYRSPLGDLDLFFNSLERLFSFLSKYRKTNKLVIGGDFNIDIMCTNTRSEYFRNLLKSFDIYCTNFSPTRYNACLDNVATDLAQDNFTTEVTSLALSDHDGVCLNIFVTENEVESHQELAEPVFLRPFSDDKLVLFLGRLQCVDWGFLNICSGADVNFDLFLDTFLELFYECFPLKQCRPRPSPKQSNLKKYKDIPWLSQSLIDMKKWVVLAYDLFKRNKTLENKARYASLRKGYRRALKEAKLEYNASKIESSSNKCQAAWKLIRTEMSSSRPRCTELSPDSFNDYFVDSVLQVRNDIGIPPASALQLLGDVQVPDSRFILSTVNETIVQNIVSRMKDSPSRDFYSISSRLVRSVIDYILAPLTFCINCSLAEGVFPARLRVSKTVPIHKKGDWSRPENFRPVAVVPIFSKILEAVVKSQLYEYFVSNNLFSSSQFGFRAGLSTIDAVERVVDEALRGFEGRGITGATLCDLSKAFDTVDHDILLKKLEFYGVTGVSLKFFESYLGGREQVVELNGRRSSARLVSHGVPQGSVLGPLLFLITINDLENTVGAELVCYADDSTILTRGDNLQILQTNMNSSLEAASVWFRANFFLLNCTKTQNIVFSLKKTHTDVTTVKLLGIVLDSKLSWSHHISNMCSKLSRVLYLLRCLKDCVPKNYLKMSYMAFFQGIVMYGIKLWGSASDVQKVLLLQKKAIRLLANAKYDAHCKPLFISEGIMTVFSLYVYVLLISAKNDLETLTIRGDYHQHLTRNREKLDIPYTRLTKCHVAYNSLRLQLLNKIPIEARNQTLSKFKIGVQKLLLANPLYSVQEFKVLPMHSVSKHFV